MYVVLMFLLIQSSPVTLTQRWPCWPSEFIWTYTGKIENYTCTKINDPMIPLHYFWYDNHFCVKSGPELKEVGIKFTHSGPDPDMRCVLTNEPSDPHTWYDNYICVPPDSPYHFKWSYAGCKNVGEYCILWYEPSSIFFTWYDNFLCHEKYGTCDHGLRRNQTLCSSAVPFFNVISKHLTALAVLAVYSILQLF